MEELTPKGLIRSLPALSPSPVGLCNLCRGFGHAPFRVAYLSLVRCMAAAKNRARRSGFVGAALFSCMGMLFLLEARRADIHDTVIPASVKHAWMSAPQGYFVAFLCFAV